MGTIVLAPSTNPAVALLAQILLNSWASPGISSPNAWPFYPDSLDFSKVGDITISCNGPTALVTFKFNGHQPPVLSGVIDLIKLQAQLMSAPNYVTINNPSPLGPASSLELDAPPITRQKSGVMKVSARWNGTQAAQGVVTVQVLRDSTVIWTWQISPGGVGQFSWAGDAALIDVAPDSAAHTYKVIATGAVLSLATGAVGLDVFEIGGPG